MTPRVHAEMIGWAVLLITAGMDVLVLLKGVPTNVDSTITGVILGVWHAACGAVVAFYFGSNSESSRKTELLAAATPAAKEPTAAQAASRAESHEP